MLGILPASNSRGQMTLKSMTAEDNCCVAYGLSMSRRRGANEHACTVAHTSRDGGAAALQPVCLVFIISSFPRGLASLISVTPPGVRRYVDG
jgi:hypothetical protein